MVIHAARLENAAVVLTWVHVRVGCLSRAQPVNRVVDVGLELDPIVEGDDRFWTSVASLSGNAP
jgi:hypothetical protein